MFTKRNAPIFAAIVTILVIGGLFLAQLIFKGQKKENDIPQFVTPDIQSIQKVEQLHSGYFILDDYLWHDGKKLINESFKTWYDPQENPDVEYGEWFQRSDDKYVYFYIAAGAGCGGCFWKEDSYLIIDKSNDKVTKKKLKSNGTDGKRLDLFKRPADRQVLSNDKEKVAYVTFDKKSNQQAVYVYDFISQSAAKIKEISTNEFLYKCDMMCEFEKDALYWDDLGKLIINPHKKQEGIEYYFR